MLEAFIRKKKIKKKEKKQNVKQMRARFIIALSTIFSTIDILKKETADY